MIGILGIILGGGIIGIILGGGIIGIILGGGILGGGLLDGRLPNDNRHNRLAWWLAYYAYWVWLVGCYLAGSLSRAAMAASTLLKSMRASVLLMSWAMRSLHRLPMLPAWVW